MFYLATKPWSCQSRGSTLKGRSTGVTCLTTSVGGLDNFVAKYKRPYLKLVMIINERALFPQQHSQYH